MLRCITAGFKELMMKTHLTSKLLACCFITLLTACSPEPPSTAQLKQALMPIAQQQGCFSYALLKTLPISPKSAKRNQTIIEPLASEQLLQKTAEGGYQLTDKGRHSYSQKASGFCFTDHYQLSDIKIKNTMSGRALPSSVEQAWFVSFTLTPDHVADWAYNKTLHQMVAPSQFAAATQPQYLAVRLARMQGSDAIQLADPGFNFDPKIGLLVNWTPRDRDR